jgi:hypothetical protein
MKVPLTLKGKGAKFREEKRYVKFSGPTEEDYYANPEVRVRVPIHSVRVARRKNHPFRLTCPLSIQREKALLKETKVKGEVPNPTGAALKGFIGQPAPVKSLSTFLGRKV